MRYTKNKEDQRVLEGIIAGDEVIIKAFYRRNYGYIKEMILQNKGCQEDIEDVIQDALMLIFQKLKSDNLRLYSSLQPYFYGICKNIWKNRLRKKQRLLMDDVILRRSRQTGDSIIDAIESNERENLYRKHFAALSTSRRELLLLFFEGKKATEIAKIKGCSAGYIRKMKFSSKKALLEMIENDRAYPELKAS